MPFLPLFTGIRHLAHVLAVPPPKAHLLCATPAGLDLYIQAMPVGTYRVQSPGFSKFVYWGTHLGADTLPRPLSSSSAAHPVAPGARWNVIRKQLWRVVGDYN